MRLLVWLLRAVLLLLLFGLAVKNSTPVELHLYFDALWQVPLSLLVLCCFAAGVALGASAAVFAQVRQRHEINALKKRLEAEAPAAGVHLQ